MMKKKKWPEKGLFLLNILIQAVEALIARLFLQNVYLKKKISKNLHIKEL